MAVAFGATMILPVGILLTSDKPVLERAAEIWPLLIGPLLFCILGSPYIRWRTRQMSNRLLSEGQNTGFNGECELLAGVDALTETRPSGSTIRNWASVERIVATPSHLFVYTSGIEAYVVPRRAFSTESEFNTFTDVVAQRSGIEVQTFG